MNKEMQNSEGDKIPESINKQAAKWVWLMDDGMTAGQQDEFFDWLSEDSQHSKAFEANSQSYKRLNKLIDWQPEHTKRPNADLLAPPQEKRKIHILYPVLGAAAILALFLSIVVTVNRSVEYEPVLAINQNGETILEDGSIIHSNINSELEVHYSEDERRVTLITGEAYFGVAKDLIRPFIVTAKNVELQAIGTAFNVRLENDLVEVFVEEGVVQLKQEEAADDGQSADAPLISVQMLNPYDRAQVSTLDHAEPRLEKMTDIDVKNELSWQHRILVFKGEALENIVAEFNRLNQIQMYIDAPELESALISGTIRSDNIEGLGKLLNIGFGISYEYENSDLIRLYTAD